MFKKFIYLPLVLSIIVFAGCSSSDDDSNSGNEDADHSYTGTSPETPGGGESTLARVLKVTDEDEFFYSVDMNSDGTFRVEASDELGGDYLVYVEGNYEEVNGFARMTLADVTTGTDDVNDCAGKSDEDVEWNNPPECGETFTALHMPGIMLLLLSQEGSTDADDFIPMIAMGDCPEDDFNINFIATDTDEDDISEEDAGTFGTAQYHAETATTGMAALESAFSLNDFNEVAINPEDAESSPGSCENGAIVFSDSQDTTTVFVTPSGAMLIDSAGSDDSTTLLGTTGDSVSADDLASKTFAGFYVHSDGDDKFIHPIKVEVDENGEEAIGYPYSDLSSGTLSEDDAGTITFDSDNFNSPSDGFIQATLTSSSTTNMICTQTDSTDDAGKLVLFCLGLDPDETTKPFILLLASYDE